MLGDIVMTVAIAKRKTLKCETRDAIDAEIAPKHALLYYYSVET
jgi:hypothetical protein